MLTLTLSAPPTELRPIAASFGLAVVAVGHGAGLGPVEPAPVDADTLLPTRATRFGPAVWEHAWREGDLVVPAAGVLLLRPPQLLPRRNPRRQVATKRG